MDQGFLGKFGKNSHLKKMRGIFNCMNRIAFSNFFFYIFNEKKIFFLFVQLGHGPRFFRKIWKKFPFEENEGNFQLYEQNCVFKLFFLYFQRKKNFFSLRSVGPWTKVF